MAEVLALLLLGAEAVQRPDHDQRHAVGRDRDLPARELLQEQRRVEERAARAAVLLGDLEPVPAELAHARRNLVRVGVLVRALEALASSEVADRLDERALLLGEPAVGRLAVKCSYAHEVEAIGVRPGPPSTGFRLARLEAVQLAAR